MLRIWWPTLLAAMALFAVVPARTHAQLVSDAARLGSFAGAMKFCEERFDERGERRYRWARMRAYSEIDRMDRDQRLRAASARRRAYERGTFLGNPLDREECRGLLRMSEWRRYSRD